MGKTASPTQPEEGCRSSRICRLPSPVKHKQLVPCPGNKQPNTPPTHGSACNGARPNTVNNMKAEEKKKSTVKLGKKASKVAEVKQKVDNGCNGSVPGQECNGKPKSRLLAVKNRLRPKKDDLPATVVDAKASGGLIKAIGRPGVATCKPSRQANRPGGYMLPVRDNADARSCGVGRFGLAAKSQSVSGMSRDVTPRPSGLPPESQGLGPPPCITYRNLVHLRRSRTVDDGMETGHVCSQDIARCDCRAHYMSQMAKSQTIDGRLSDARHLYGYDTLYEVTVGPDGRKDNLCEKHARLLKANNVHMGNQEGGPTSETLLNGDINPSTTSQIGVSREKLLRDHGSKESLASSITGSITGSVTNASIASSLAESLASSGATSTQSSESNYYTVVRPKEGYVIKRAYSEGDSWHGSNHGQQQEGNYAQIGPQEMSRPQPHRVVTDKGVVMKRSATYQGMSTKLEEIPEHQQMEYSKHTAEKSLEKSSCIPEETVAPPSGTSRGGLRVTDPEDLKAIERSGGRYGVGSGPTPRRHTVTVGGMDLEMGQPNREQKFEKQREAFLELLAKRFPDHADVIKAKEGPLYGKLGHPRRKTTTVTYNLDQNQSLVYESDEGAMSEGDTSATGLRRGKIRTTLPVVRSPNRSTERALGLVFLIFRNETKRALLPNEITTIDTVRALFVRSFPDDLSMSYLESRDRKIYVLDPATNVYYELEDLRDIKDRTVLKVYEKDGPPPPHSRSPSMSPKACQRNTSYYTSGNESDSSTRSAPPMTGGPRSPLHHPAYNQRVYSQEVIHEEIYQKPSTVNPKAQSLPIQPNYVYQQQMAQYATFPEAQASGQPLSPSHRQYQHQHSNHNSPQRIAPHNQAVMPNQRHSVAYIPDANSAFPMDARLPQSRSYHDYHEQSRSGSTTPTAEDGQSKYRMEKMEAQLANLTHWVQAAVMKTDSHPGSARSSSSIHSDCSSSAKSTPDGSVSDSHGDKFSVVTPQRATYVYERPPKPPCTAHSIPQKSTFVSHRATAAPRGKFVNFANLESQNGHMVSSSISDISSATPQPITTVAMQNSIRSLNARAQLLKHEVRQLRRLQLANAETMRDTINSTFLQIKEVLDAVPGADNQPIRAQRVIVDRHVHTYKDDASKMEQNLNDLECSVEELRNDVLNKRCRVNMNEVQSMALALSNISKNLADLKAKFPVLHDSMKNVMSGEMAVVVKEERFVKEEPERIDQCLKRCKKLTDTLVTLKSLASVQEKKPVSQPVVSTASPSEQGRRAVLDNIQCMVPDHEARLQSLEAADASRERKKKLTTTADTLKFEKTLEMAQKQLRETNNIVENEQRAEKVLNIVAKESDIDKDNRIAKIPLTGTTKRLNLVTQNAPENGPKQNGPTKCQDAKQLGKLNGSGKPLSPTQVRANGNQENGGAPQKPPRTMLYDGPPPPVTYSGEVVTVKSPPATANKPCGSPALQGSDRNLANTKDSPLTTFSPPNSCASPTASPTKTVDVSRIPKCSSNLSSPTKVPSPTTSTPINPRSQNHVTFSGTVTEIKDVGPADKNGRPKKIPPPPPPRRSSRSTMLPNPTSPQGTPVTRRAISPPAYENIENFAKRDIKKPPPLNLNHSRSSSVPAEGPRPKMQGPPQQNKGKSLSKYQQDLAAGITANLNRPDLQEQVSNTKAGHQPAGNKDTAGVQDSVASSDTESTTSGDSQSGFATMRRINNGQVKPLQNGKAVSDTQLNGQNGKESRVSKDGVVMREGKKVPPPPPVRRTSALSAAPGDKPGDAEKRRSVAELQQHFQQQQDGATEVSRQNSADKHVANGNLPHTVKGQSGVVKYNTQKGTSTQAAIISKAAKKKYEETEIY